VGLLLRPLDATRQCYRHGRHHGAYFEKISLSNSKWRYRDSCCWCEASLVCGTGTVIRDHAFFSSVVDLDNMGLMFALLPWPSSVTLFYCPVPLDRATVTLSLWGRLAWPSCTIWGRILSRCGHELAFIETKVHMPNKFSAEEFCKTVSDSGVYMGECIFMYGCMRPGYAFEYIGIGHETHVKVLCSHGALLVFLRSLS
jgi:hypothetical protein